MAKGSNKNATKSFVMLIVTGVVLVAVTLCWFALTNKSTVDSISSSVDNDALSKAVLFVGKTSNDEIAITADTNNKKCIAKYEIAETVGEAIVLENMIPGGEYFYKAEFDNCKNGQKITFQLDGFELGSPSLKDAIMVSHFVEKDDGTLKTSTGRNEGVINNSSFTYPVEEDGKHAVYFSFRFINEAEVEDYGNASVKINNVNIVLSD